MPHSGYVPSRIPMQRITQMYVIPDLLPPSAVPSVDVTLDFGSDIGVIEPGVFVKPANSIRPPILKVANFHEDTRLYTVLMVDPDLPDPERMTYQQHCHWLITNVALSATSPIVTNGDVALPYIPPHPQRGTKYHRYTVMVLEQPRGGKQSVHVDATERAGFDAAAFRERHGLVPKGVSFFRGVWDEDVTRIYNEILGTREPIFGKPPKIDPYIMETGRKRKKYLTV
ncbi:hypothetical protein BC936DRAFT_140247 [Jimgerdemannia flammicorona]|uniref:Phosphatidylethanolamine-binding protein n=1 Tax=Jimgerdemannia flammicorona TaxID=994334 RepID=A0A433DGY0_9FUNG|nr:hypothetical protein BC936DRAFT_140247 [Jimgerdemannia flammicorona]